MDKSIARWAQDASSYPGPRASCEFENRTLKKERHDHSPVIRTHPDWVQGKGSAHPRVGEAMNTTKRNSQEKSLRFRYYKSEKIARKHRSDISRTAAHPQTLLTKQIFRTTRLASDLDTACNRIATNAILRLLATLARPSAGGDAGVAQGAPISPVLANIYLHPTRPPDGHFGIPRWFALPTIS